MRVVIWGCGEYGKKILPNLVTNSDIQIVAYTDSNADLWGKECCHFPIINPDEISNTKFDFVFIAVNSFRSVNEIKNKLIQLKVAENRIVDVSLDNRYLELFMDARFSWIRDYARWIYDNNICGSVAECGVFRGDSAKFINKFFFDRKLYLCDTFEGFAEEDLHYELEQNNRNFNASRFSSKQFFAETSVEKVMQKMTYPENVVIKQGYFPDCAKDINDKFCFVNLDMDLHVPMLNGIRFFWDKLEDGCCILLHDYFSEEFAGVKRAVDIFEQERKIKLLKTPIGDGCSLALWKAM